MTELTIHSLEDIATFVDDHLNQKSQEELEGIIEEAEGDYINAYALGLFEGIVNGLALAGIDVTKLEGMIPKEQ